MSAKIFHPLLAMIASATDRELARYVEFLKVENRILRSRIPGQVHTKPEERSRLVKLGRDLGRAIEELITLVSPATFYRWCREEPGSSQKKRNPTAGKRKPREIRELFIEIAKTTNFGTPVLIEDSEKLGPPQSSMTATLLIVMSSLVANEYPARRLPGPIIHSI